MDTNTIIEIITKIEPNAVIKDGVQFPEIVIPAESVQKVAMELRNNPEMKFDFLYCQTGVDIKGELGVIYHLRSTSLNHQCAFKVFTSDRENPAFDTVSNIWHSANPFEREIFDLFGIRFNNHPDLRRLFLEDDFKGYPLRKDFVDEVNIIQK